VDTVYDSAMPTSAGLTPRARALAAAIRDLRESAGISGRALSIRLGLSHGMVSNWETCQRLPSPEDVASLLTALDIVGEGKVSIDTTEKERLLDLARHAAEPNWLTIGMPGIPQQLAGAVESERAASAITEWHPMVIPGLLQTADYARAIAKASGLSDPQIEQRVMVRMSRREIITRRDPVEFLALIGEAALREPIGRPEVMIDQLRFLLEISGRPNVDVRIIKLGVGWHPGFAGPFVVYAFPDAPPVIHFEHFSSGAFVPDAADVEAYTGAVEFIKNVAMSPAATTVLIAEIADEMERRHEQ
jgi:transcriptional regulator with XRE-family HTH domain